MTYNINVLAVIWFPLLPDGETLDESITGFNSTKTEAIQYFSEMRAAYDLFMDDASHAQISHTIVGNIEIWEALPLANGDVDYAAIVNRITTTLLNSLSVDQIWLDSYTRHAGSEVRLGWETIMGSKWGNTSNSLVDTPLPVANKTYIIVSFPGYHDLVVSSHYIAHQIENMLIHVDKSGLFLTNFCGCESISSQAIAQNGIFRCGNVHYPPNGVSDYNYDNETLVTSDIVDWKPDGGIVSQVNRETWGQFGGNYHYGWLKFWLKRIPHGNGLTWKGQQLTNWWRFLADWDGCMEEKLGLFLPVAANHSPQLPTTKNPCMDKLVMPIVAPISAVNPPAPLVQPVPLAVLENLTPDPVKNYPNQLWEVKILQLVYFPLTQSGTQLDIGITGDVGGSLTTMRAHVEAETAAVISALEEGCHETIAYRVMGRIEINEAYPTTRGTDFRASGYYPALVDYKAILNRFDINSWVESGVSQVWIWGYHGGKVTIWESNMSSEWGNISNSDKNKNELPLVTGKSYTVYNFNYGRGAAEALESYLHQIESVLYHVEKDLFWLMFVGAENHQTGRLVATNGVYRCGWSHYCPNSIEDYDWFNPRVVTSDIGDWRPNGGGATAAVSAATWSATDDGGKTWFIAWMRAIPRENNGLTYNGQPLTNWWEFLGDFDGAMTAGKTLTG